MLPAAEPVRRRSTSGPSRLTPGQRENLFGDDVRTISGMGSADEYLHLA